MIIRSERFSGDYRHMRLFEQRGSECKRVLCPATLYATDMFG